MLKNLLILPIKIIELYIHIVLDTILFIDSDKNSLVNI